MDPSRLFRKVALERMASPEQLDQLLQVTAPRGWLALFAVLALVAAAVGWGFLGSVSTTVPGRGALVRDADGRLHALVFVPVASANAVRTGMAARVMPAMALGEEPVFVHGRVAGVSDEPAGNSELERVLRSRSVAADLEAAGPVAAVRVDLEADPGAPDGFRWSSAKAAPARLGEGTPCTADIVVRTERPIGLVFPSLGSRPRPN